MVPLCPCVPLRAGTEREVQRWHPAVSEGSLTIVATSMTFVRLLVCASFGFVCLSVSEALKCRTELNDRQNEGFFDIARACAQNSGTTSGSDGGGGGGGMGGNSGGGGMSGGGRPWLQNTQDSGRGGGNGGGRHQSNQYGNQNNDRYCSSGYQNSDRDRPRFSSSGSGGGGGNDDDFYTKTQSEQRFRGDGGGGGRTRPGQYRVKVQYGSGQGGGPDSRAYPLGRKRRATKIISNNAKNATGRNPTSSETGKTSLLEELDACVVQCIFRQMEMLTEDARPDKNSVISVMTQRIRDPELKEFIQESIEECFDIIESDAEGGKCEYSKNFAMCLEEKGRRNCEDWEEAAQINRFKGIQSGMSPPDTTNNYNPPNFNNFNSNNQGNRQNAFYNYNGK